MKEEKSILKFLKSIALLILLFGFWYGISKVSLLYKNITVKDSVEASETTEKSTNTTSDVVIEDLQEEDLTAVETYKSGEVEAASTSTETACSEIFNELITIPVYLDNSGGDVDYKDGSPQGTYVSKNAKIEVAYVSVPSVLLAGSSQVKNSSKVIGIENADLKAAGDVFDYDYGAHLESPDSLTDYKSTISAAVYKEKFGSEVEMAYQDDPEAGNGGGSVTDINVGTSKESICLACQDSNYNPDISNIISTEANETLSVPGGQTVAPQNNDTYLTVDMGEVEDLPKAEEGCQRTPPSIRTVVELVTGAISNALFNKCNETDEDGNLLYPDECVRVEDIVIRTNSFFGDFSSCQSDDKCVNTFMNRRILSAMDPVSASDFDNNFMVTTECGVNIEGKYYTVKCLWDMSYIALEYYYQWEERYPGKEYPSWNSYWSAIEEDYLSRF